MRRAALRLVATFDAGLALLFAVLKLFAGFAGFALDFRFIVQVLVLAVGAVGARGFGRFKLRAGQTKRTVVRSGGGERLDFALRAVGARVCLGVQSVLSFGARFAPAFGVLRLALVLALRAGFTLIVREESARVAARARCGVLRCARRACGSAATVASARLLFTHAIFSSAWRVGRTLTVRTRGTALACLIRKPSIAVCVTRRAFFGTIFGAFRTRRGNAAVARAYILDASALSVFVLAVVALCAFRIAVLWTVRASGGSFACSGARALFKSALTVLRGLYRSRLLIV